MLTAEDLDTEVRRLAAALDDEREAELLLSLFEIASNTAFEPDANVDEYTPFVYPH